MSIHQTELRVKLCKTMGSTKCFGKTSVVPLRADIIIHSNRTIYGNQIEYSVVLCPEHNVLRECSVGLLFVHSHELNQSLLKSAISYRSLPECIYLPGLLVGF